MPDFAATAVDAAPLPAGIAEAANVTRPSCCRQTRWLAPKTMNGHEVGRRYTASVRG